MKNRIFFIFILCLLVIVAIIYDRSHFSSTLKETKSNPVVSVHASQVKEHTVSNEIKALGVLTGQQTQISSEVAGHIKSINFKDGSFVKKGTILIQLDDELFRIRALSAQASLNYQQAQYKRMQQLQKSKVVTQQMLDQIQSDLKHSQANLQENQLMINKMKLLAPFDGKVSNSLVTLGDYVAVGQKIVNLSDTTHLRVEYHVPERYYASLKLGQDVLIKTAAYPNQIFKAKISYIAPTISQETQSIQLYASIENTQDQLSPGMFVNIMHQLSSTKKVLMVPARSLLPSLEGEKIYIIQEGKAHLVSIQTGKRIDNWIEVIKGLQPNMQIITDGQLKIKEGSYVTVV